jgi:hypothetical protein
MNTGIMAGIAMGVALAYGTRSQGETYPEVHCRSGPPTVQAQAFWLPVYLQGDTILGGCPHNSFQAARRE